MKEILGYIFSISDSKIRKMYETCSHAKSFTLWCSYTRGCWLINIPSMFFKITEFWVMAPNGSKTHTWKSVLLFDDLYSMCLNPGQRLFGAFGIRYITPVCFWVLSSDMPFVEETAWHHCRVASMIQLRVFPVLVNCGYLEFSSKDGWISGSSVPFYLLSLGLLKGWFLPETL